ncbi:hypothetical protein [Clostridium sp.]|uniref:hypothetical protein n=1 Tax=Clostridium sp. TaxID=1506 RepID=UPI001EC9DED9|nr:hypothetical protein [Clostridium sp.]MBS5885151.1 hypothetical protein [Clostridium sp.]
MRVSRNIIISIGITLVASVGISALVFKPMGTVATEKNNTELYLQMKEQAKAEVQAEFDKQLEQVKKDTDEQIEKLRVEYDKAMADAKLEQANNLQAAIQQANANAEEAINQATSPEEIERRRQEERKNNPIEVPKIEYNPVPPSKED